MATAWGCKFCKSSGPLGQISGSATKSMYCTWDILVQNLTKMATCCLWYQRLDFFGVNPFQYLSKINTAKMELLKAKCMVYMAIVWLPHFNDSQRSNHGSSDGSYRVTLLHSRTVLKKIAQT